MNTEDYRKQQILQPHQHQRLDAMGGDMDNSYYFAPPAGQPYHFLGLPPTPQHNAALGGGDFSDDSPPVRLVLPSTARTASNIHLLPALHARTESG